MKSTTNIPGVITELRSTTSGPRVVLLGGIHGNELCGVEAMKRLFPSIVLKQGSVVFVEGNPEALTRKVRFVEANLNRLFRPDAELNEAQKTSYEYARSRELMPLLLSADAVLDIHGSNSPVSEPFAIYVRRSRSIAEQLPFPIVSTGWDVIEPGGTDDFAERNGKIGLGIECGYIGDANAIFRAEESILRFLSLLGLIEPLPAPVGRTQRRIRATYAHMPETGFTPIREFADFEEVRKDELIGMDGAREMRAPKDGCVIFVRTRSAPGQEAYIFAEEEY